MEKPVIISLIVLAMISVVEFLCLYLCRSKPMKRPPLTVTAPVFSDVDQLSAALDRIRDAVLYGRAPIDRIILIDFEAYPQCLAICEDFCRDFPETSIVRAAELENFLAEIFAIEENM